MKKILVSVTLAFALALPSVASANEPAEWYMGDLPAGEGLEASVFGYIDIENPSLGWSFRCEVGGELYGSNGFYTEANTCNANPPYPYCKFNAEFNSAGTPMVPSKEGESAEVDTENSFIRLFYGGCPGYYGGYATLQGVGLHGTWENISPPYGKIKIDPFWTTYGTRVEGELSVVGKEGNYMVEVGEEEFEEVYGYTPISIR